MKRRYDEEYQYGAGSQSSGYNDSSWDEEKKYGKAIADFDGEAFRKKDPRNAAENYISFRKGDRLTLLSIDKDYPNQS